MANMKSDLASELHGKLGDKLYRTLETGKILVTPTPKLPTFRDEKDKEERDKRMNEYGGCSHVYSVVYDAVKLGIPREKRGEQPLGKFMKLNAKTLCKVVENEKGELVREYKYEKLIVAAGNRIQIEIGTKFDEETNSFTFEQTADERQGSRAKPDDMAYILLLESVNEEAQVLELRVRSSNGYSSFTLPNWWDKDKVFVYTFNVSRDKKKSSPSSFLYPIA